MQTGTNPDYDEVFAAALDWWREAGVDATFLDEPRSWIAPTEPAPDSERRRPTPRGMAPVIEAPPAAPVIPDDLEAFQSWWMSAPELDGGRCTGRVPPRGVASPELMVLVCAPEGDDGERLLSGPEGRLLDAFIAACGLAEQQIYRASALPCHSPGTDWSPAANRVIADALAKHIALVAPKRIMVIGFVILPLLGHGSPQGPAVSLSFNHGTATIPLLAVRRMPALPSQGRWKSALWQAWLDWAA